MNELQYFEIMGDHGEFRPKGEVSQQEMVRLVTAAIVFARERQVRKLLVVTTELTGFDPPSVVDRYYFIHDWARASGHAMRFAIVARPEMIHPSKFGTTVALNSGFMADIFASEKEALEWLLLAENR